MQLTEGLSLTVHDHTELQAGMVLTLEPGIDVASGGIMVHEENILITDAAAVALSPFAGPDLPII
jgi:Xaa-Pro aminopeptidase